MASSTSANSSPIPPERFPHFRPPGEADSVILGVTVGCPHNACSFCGMYRDLVHRVRTETEFARHVALAARLFPSEERRVFLGDGDALCLPAESLLARMSEVRRHFPRAGRFAAYARAEGLLAKTPEELQALAVAGLRTVYLGLESGDEDLLARLRKGCTAAQMIAAARRASEAGLRVSVMALIGLAGRSGSERHAQATAAALSAMRPRFISLLTYIPVEGTEWARAVEAGEIELLDDREALRETRLILVGLDCPGAVFRADHASNPLPLGGNLPRDQERLLAELDAGLAGEERLRPLWLRGL